MIPYQNPKDQNRSKYRSQPLDSILNQLHPPPVPMTSFSKILPSPFRFMKRPVLKNSND